ncbi:MAG: hypothetical protein JXA46_10145 [Dehalococcoidales bacterium]|nr:hypothetical protein [Dehalococcoidales bacterium]
MREKEVCHTARRWIEDRRKPGERSVIIVHEMTKKLRKNGNILDHQGKYFLMLRTKRMLNPHGKGPLRRQGGAMF